jgi:hypothetical protein
MNKYCFANIFFIMLILCFLVIGCNNDLLDDDNKNITNDETSDNETLDNGSEDIVDDDPLNLLKGTIWYADRGSLFIEFPNNHLILFRNHQNYGNIGGNLNGDVTLGNFRLSSYDGETMRLLNYDNLEVAFSVIVSENKMVIHGLGAIKCNPPPFQPRDFRSYNQTFTKGER